MIIAILLSSKEYNISFKSQKNPKDISMDFKLAKPTLDSKSAKISLKQIEGECVKDGKIYYFSNENAHKDLLKIVETFESKGRNAYLREARYGLDEKEYIYELHII